MKDKKIIIMFVCFIIMFLGMNELKAASSATCVYRITKDNLDFEVKYEVTESGISKIPTTKSYTGKDVWTNWAAGWEKTKDKFFINGDSRFVQCPNIYVGEGNGTLLNGIKLSFNSSDNKFEDIWPDGVSYDPQKSKISNPEYNPDEVDDDTLDKLEEIEKTQKENESIVDDRVPNEVGGKLSCGQILGENGKQLVRIVILLIRIITPILLFTFTALEFMKAIPQQDEDAIVKAWKRFGTRGIVTAIIMLLPTFLNVLGVLFDFFDNCDIW